MIIYELDPLPDFLQDHTLLGKTEAERIQESLDRWTHFVTALWNWHNSACFALRFVARDGCVRPFFCCRARDDARAEELRAEMEVCLRTHRLIRTDPERLVVPQDFAAACVLKAPKCLVLAQFHSRELWTLADRGISRRIANDFGLAVAEGNLTENLVVYPWHGAAGPFLLPFESLISQGRPCMVTIYLTPTVLTAEERRSLSVMAMIAQSQGEQNLTLIGQNAGIRCADPAASLAASIYMAHFKRLNSAPFLVTAQCAAQDDTDGSVVRSLAGALMAMIHNTPGKEVAPNVADLPTGVSSWGSDEALEEMSFELWERVFSATGLPEHLRRMPFLMDAGGATTLFRLPISVRGGIPGIRVRQLPPDFNPGSREMAVPKHYIKIGRLEGGGYASVPVDSLTRHMLITGSTGSGKTVTILNIIHQLWVQHKIPVLVIESSKQEYRGLLGVEAFRDSPKESRDYLGMRIYTVGNESCVPLRINPFELLPGVRVETHIGRLQVSMEAAIPPVGPSSSIIAESLQRVYEQFGWVLVETGPNPGTSQRRFPMLRDFVQTVEAVIKERGYSGEVYSNIQAALLGRFRPLLLGSKGAMFNVQRSIPTASELLSAPVVLELNDLNLDDKALVTVFLLTILREYCETSRGVQRSLKHVTVVEEAHNILASVGSEGSGEGATKADTRFKAVEAFSLLLTEIRAFGEGLVILDQSPQKLARDVMRNTNVQIAHQLRETEDRVATANAMIMDDEQRDYLAKLESGCAAVFYTGLEKATFVKVDGYGFEGASLGYGFSSRLSDAEIMDYMKRRGMCDDEQRVMVLPFPECRLCREQCLHRDVVFSRCCTPESLEWGRAWFELLDPQKRHGEGLIIEDVWERIARRSHEIIAAGLTDVSPERYWCYFIHIYQNALTFFPHLTEDTALTQEVRERYFATLEELKIFPPR